MPQRGLIAPAGMENIYRDKGYAPGVRVGDMLYVSGMLGRDALRDATYGCPQGERSS